MQQRQKTVALVIGSGGMKSLGSIVFFEFLTKYNLKPDIIICCSGGTILSSRWAAGYSIDDCNHFIRSFFNQAIKYKFFTDFNFRTLLNIAHLPGGKFHRGSGIIHSKKILAFLKEAYSGLNLENLPIKFSVATTNLDTGELVLLENGPLAEAIYASCAIYPYFPPIYHQGKWLVDGAYSAATPTLTATQLGYDKIISLSFSEKHNNEFSSFASFIPEYIYRILNSHAAEQNTLSVYLHHDETLFIDFKFDKQILFSDFHLYDSIKDICQKKVDEHKENIIEMFNS